VDSRNIGNFCANECMSAQIRTTVAGILACKRFAFVAL